MENALGRMIAGRYRLAELIGKGGMGDVYAADDLRLPGKRWAVKIWNGPAPLTPLFLQEARLLAGLSHPNVMHIADFVPDEAQGGSCIVMELVHGVTLQQWFEQKNRRAEPEEVIRIGLQLCDALYYLHEQLKDPVVFRDLKPSNVMIDDTKRIKLIDFGIARTFKAGQKGDTVPLGTIGFASPEQLAGRQTDRRGDLYALGALLYFLLSRGAYYVLEKRSLSEINPKVPPQLSEVISKAVQDHPEDRFRTAREMADALGACLKQDTLGGVSSSGRTLLAHNRRIAVCGLYPGAGATSVALLASAWMRARGIPHAVVEGNTGEGEMAYWLEHANGDNPTENPQKLGVSAWHLKRPEEEAADVYQALSSIKEAVAFMDAGAGWMAPPSMHYADAADEIWIVTGVSVPKLMTMGTERALGKLTRWQEKGKRIAWIVNGVSDSSWKKEIGPLLPEKPASVIPTIPLTTWRLLLQSKPGRAMESILTPLDSLMKHSGIMQLEKGLRDAGSRRKRMIWM